MAAAAILVLTGCAPALPEPNPPGVPAVPPPVLSVEQSERVLGAIGTSLASADGALSPAGLEARLSGPALATRTAEYLIATATAGAKPPTTLPMNAQTLVVPTGQEWPRTQFVVTEQPDDLTSPRLLVLQQANPRADYTLWGWTRLLPGVKMPATATPEIGSAPVAADAADLVASPTDVVARYSDVLLNGDASAFIADFAAPDPYRNGIVAARAPFAKIAIDASGTFTETSAPVADQTMALATADGGALVVAAMATTSVLTFGGGSLPLPAEYAALSGGALAAGANLRSNLTTNYADVVAFYVPPSGASTPIQVLGAEHVRTSVTGA